MFVDNRRLIVSREKETEENYQSCCLGANRGATKAEMFSFIRHPFLAPEMISFMPDSEEGSSPLPRDVRLLPWSHNILAAMWHHVHLSLKGTAHRCGRQAQGQTPGPSLPPTHLVLCTHTSALGLPPTHQGAWLWRPCMSKALTCRQAACHYCEPCWICRRTLHERTRMLHTGKPLYVDS